jgi:hypothetical protein
VAQKLGLDLDKYTAWAKLPLSELFEVTSEEGFEG